MTEPTLTELREIAVDKLPHYMLNKPIRKVLEAFLALTDPEPLNVLQVQALRLEQDDDNEHEYVNGDNPVSLVSVLMGGDSTAISLTVGNPTPGMLRLALLQENRDGE